MTTGQPENPDSQDLQDFQLADYRKEDWRIGGLECWSRDSITPLLPPSTGETGIPTFFTNPLAKNPPDFAHNENRRR
jgi:hypothetical protein